MPSEDGWKSRNPTIHEAGLRFFQRNPLRKEPRFRAHPSLAPRLRTGAVVIAMFLGVLVGPQAVVAGDDEPGDGLRSDDIAADVFDTPPRDQIDVGPPLGLLNATGRVTVEIVHTPGADQDIRHEVARFDGRVLGESPGVILAEVPSARVPTLDRRSDVEYVRAPLRVDLTPDPSYQSVFPLGAGDIHVTATNADAWQAIGHLGDGVKVGIVDYFDGTIWGAALASGVVPPAAGTFCQNTGVPCDLWSAGSPHGVAVAETIFDMAPGATLYLATAVTATDLAAAVAWFDSQGVQIITRSLGSQLDGPGDGTGSVDAIVDDAVSRGMVWFNAAGNLASSSGTSLGGYWRAGYTDADADGWLDFAPGDEAMGFVCGGILGFRWSDWSGPNPTDYDIYITDLGTGTIVASSYSDQTSGAPPLELIDPSAIDCAAHPVLGLWVNLFNAGSGTAGDVLEFMVNLSAFEYSSNPYSASQPATDSANPGMVAVGAIDPPGGIGIAAYSSQGPTNDARIKPDLSAPSCLPSLAYSPDCFNGTSAATPVVAGAAALLISAGVASTPTEISQYLKTNVIDRGAAGADSVYGTGQLLLGAPPSSIPAASVGDAVATEGGTAQFAVTLSGASASTVTVNYATANNSAASPADYTAKTGTVTFVPGDVSETFEVVTIDDGLNEGTETFLVNLSAPVNATIADGQAWGTVLDVNEPSPIDTVGLVDPASGQWHLYNVWGSEVASFYFGNPGDFPVMGDWDGDGIETPGMYRQSDGFVYLRNSNTQGIADIKFFFGNPGDVPVAGDFNGDGRDTLSIYRASNQTFYIINELGQNNGGLGAAEIFYVFGNPGDKPFVGDFNGDGQETVGLHRESTGLVYFRNRHSQGNADNQFIYGDPGDRLVAGDWTGDDTFSPALFRPGNTTVYFRYTNTQGNANFLFTAGQSGWLPVAGHTGLS